MIPQFAAATPYQRVTLVTDRWHLNTVARIMLHEGWNPVTATHCHPGTTHQQWQLETGYNERLHKTRHCSDEWHLNTVALSGRRLCPCPNLRTKSCTCHALIKGSIQLSEVGQFGTRERKMSLLASWSRFWTQLLKSWLQLCFHLSIYVQNLRKVTNTIFSVSGVTSRFVLKGLGYIVTMKDLQP